MALPIRSLPPKKRGLTLVAPQRDEAEVSDSALVALVRAGEPSAFERLYRRHASYALALAVRVQGHVGDAEDIVHDAFLRVHDHLADLRADASFKAWFSSIVVSLVRTRLRRRRMLSALGLVPSEPVDLDALVHSDAGPEIRAQLAQIYVLLNQVPVDHRICWTLRYLEGRKLEDVAEVAGCSLATAKRRIASVQERINSIHVGVHAGVHEHAAHELGGHEPGAYDQEAEEAPPWSAELCRVERAQEVSKL